MDHFFNLTGDKIPNTNNGEIHLEKQEGPTLYKIWMKPSSSDYVFVNFFFFSDISIYPPYFINHSSILLSFIYLTYKALFDKR